MLGKLTGLKISSLEGFIARKKEIRTLEEVDSDPEASVIVVKGRRRIGKTELIEQYYKSRNILKFEGLQCPPNLRENKYENDKKRQLKNCFDIFKMYLSDDAKDILNNIKNKNLTTEEKRFKESLSSGFKSWSHFFETLNSYIKESDLLYFEEIQWLSSYHDEFLSELKPFWDNYYRRKKNLRLVICGSSPSFIANKFADDQALKGRSITHIHLKPLNLSEIKEFLSVGPREAIMATLCVGGVCEYLKKVRLKLRNNHSVLQALRTLSSESNSYLLTEYDEIFVSSMQNNKHYKKVIELLSTNRFLSKPEISEKLKIKSGGALGDVLNDLVECEFIEKYVPVLKGENSKDIRYAISDEYLNYYHRFLAPNKMAIKKGDFEDHPENLIDAHQLRICMGFIFESWCRKNHRRLAEIMKFDQIKYLYGAYFGSRIKSISRGFQLDLVFVRDDDNIVFCEIKKYDGELTNDDIIEKLKESAELFISHNKKYKNYTRKYCLINPEGVNENFDRRSEVDYIITYDDLLS